MFSTNSATQVPLAYRNSRRRQRTSDDVSNPPKAKKQKSLLRDTSFDNYDTEEECEIKLGFNQSENETARRESTPPNNTGLHDTSSPAPEKLDNCDRLKMSNILVNNDYYLATHLPSVPDRVKEILREPFRCVISPDAGYCVALTRRNAILWPYSAASTSLATNDVRVLSLLELSAKPSDALPLATLISPSTHSEPGLVIVLPSTGEVLFWETVSNPTILGLIKQQRSGLQDAIPGLLSGEYATEIVNVEPAGFIVILSTGRVCHVCVRDSQGKPALNFQFLNASSRLTGGGLLGGIRNVLSSASWRKNVVAAKAGKSYRRGHRNLLVATNSGLIEVWDTHWSNGSIFKTRIEVVKAVSHALESCVISTDYHPDSYQLVDFTFREDSSSVDLEGSEDRYSLWVLLSATRQRSNCYWVVEVDIHGSQVTVGRISSVTPRPTVTRHDNLWTPRIHVPKPGHTGFIIFECGIVLLSLVPLRESPSSQLLLDGGPIPTPFQDYIKFRDENDHAILGCGVERSQFDQKSPSCLIMVQNLGLIRISVRARPISRTGVDEGRITVKSRLEQVVFYDIKGNPLDLTCYEELCMSPSALEDAALQISSDILRSNSKFVPATVASLDEQMKLRSTALCALATYLSKQHFQLSYPARWTLLSHAEKVAAHRAVWKAQENICRNSEIGGTHLEYILGQMGERFRTKFPSSNREEDLVRHWFIHDTWRMDYIVPWILHGIRDMSNNGTRLDRQLVWQILQASELSLAALGATFQLREEHAKLYGLRDCYPGINGLPMPKYSLISALWTADKVNYVESERLLDAELNVCLQWLKQKDPGGPDQTVSSMIQRIKKNIPKAFRVLWKLYMERVNWCISQASVEEQDAGKELQKCYIVHRKTHLYKMAAMGLLEESIELAENFEDMDALVELIVEMENRIGDRHPAGAGDPAYDGEMEACQLRIDKYFERFGEAWANPFYTRQILAGYPEMLVLMSPYQEHITRFLHQRPGYAKLSWMNDVLGEKDYGSASKSLCNFATSYESNLWSKQVELAIGKLCRLATLESSEKQDLASLQEDIKRFDDLSELSRIQEMLYGHIAPAIHGAIDQSAEVQLANEQFGKVIVHSKPALREALHRNLAKLVAKCPMEPDELVDTLTLIDPAPSMKDGDEDIIGHEFSLALKALSLSDLSRQDPEYCNVLEKLLWRRCMIRDDWDIINRTKQKGDKEVEDVIRSTVLFRTLSDIKDFENESELFCKVHTPVDIANSNILPQGLASRLLPEEQARLLEDFDEEAKLLRSYIERGRLDDWFTWIVGAVRSNPEET
ncbi:Nup133 nucleoporin family protein [Coccidioides posadasii C735 delta SOWgp]|uniref:Nup133 nucleoporin family protein n=1 Tax=Coccidioides posadasii (strain C735) TaxID=222929 RepID=C5P665_COCP7|nr:Nup133 nucleoporin family protein [Coccidioides posadasii C735 delta SOWgp]EER28205.1 Nup133 nucleoporin family protein [Coccidioides posadasii C735 delta SOWgp]|eukprot:XP_003070350.1 Nup133 nucleoporin family protein [Coccidioides posadasii C735 delta SOWgp]